MGLTNIHYGDHIVERAGSSMTIHAVLASITKAIILTGRGFDQEEINEVAEFLHERQRNAWLARGEDGVLHASRADDPLPVPLLHCSPGLQDPTSRAVRRVGEEVPEPPPLAYILIVRGRSAALYTKCIIRYSRSAAATVFFAEASNGYSVVFSAALLRSDVARLQNGGTRFEKVATIDGLTAPLSEGNGEVIRLWC